LVEGAGGERRETCASSRKLGSNTPCKIGRKETRREDSKKEANGSRTVQPRRIFNRGHRNLTVKGIGGEEKKQKKKKSGKKSRSQPRKQAMGRKGKSPARKSKKRLPKKKSIAPGPLEKSRKLFFTGGPAKESRQGEKMLG